MTHVSVSEHFEEAASRIWPMIGNFGGIASWHPAVSQCELRSDGTRRLTLADGGELIEHLESCDEGTRTLEYSIVSGPLPVRNYRSRMEVRDNGDGCTVSWSSDFEVAGADETEATQIVRGIYTSGLENLRKMVTTA